VGYEGRREGGLVVWRERKGKGEGGRGEKDRGDAVKVFGGEEYLRVRLHCE